MTRYNGLPPTFASDRWVVMTSFGTFNSSLCDVPLLNPDSSVAQENTNMGNSAARNRMLNSVADDT